MVDLITSSRRVRRIRGLGATGLVAGSATTWRRGGIGNRKIEDGTLRVNGTVATGVATNP